MPIQSLSIGPPTIITQNVIYALPAKQCQVITTLACETSPDQSTWTAFTSGGITSAGFIRCTTGSPTVTCKQATASGGASLPTAPLGQVLISQGAGVAPIFSSQWNPGSAAYSEFALTIPSGTIRGFKMHPYEKTVAQIGVGEFIGELANFSNSTVNTIGSNIVGGGTNHVLGRWDGTNWKVIGV
jgi:hypothetical protein